MPIENEKTLSGNATGGLLRRVGRRRAFEEIVLQIEEAIANGTLKPGDRLPPERELAVIFDVSRNSVREALRILEAFGIVAARQGRGPDAGSTVTAVERNGMSGMLRLYATVLRIPLRDLVDVRVAVETMAARAAAGRSGDEITRLVELGHADVSQLDKDAFLRLDTEFHVALASASGNMLAPLLMEALREAIAREMRRGFETLDDWTGTRNGLARAHAEIADLVASGDPDAAADAVERHVRGFYRLLIEGQSAALSPTPTP